MDEEETRQMPMDKTRYPDNWDSEIVPAVRARADNKCEACGIMNGSVIMRPTARGGKRDYTPTVVLTVAHKCHDRTLFVSEDAYNSMANLALLCQRCHLRLDRWVHAETRRRNRNKKSGQRDFIDSEMDKRHNEKTWTMDKTGIGEHDERADN